MRFQFATATEIVFGTGAVQEIPARAAILGNRAFVVTRVKPADVENIAPDLLERDVEVTRFEVTGEPSTTGVMEAVSIARSAGCDVVIAIGGGSVIDTAKAVAALLTNPADLMDYLEVIGEGHPIEQPPAPLIAVPTTAGTGAEVTRNAVLHCPEHNVKVSLRNRLMLPRTAIVDPELTYSMPPAVTASTGLDALTQLLESFVSHAANPLTDGICREGLLRAARSLRRAFEDGRNTEARKDMCVASLFGGLALANAKLGAVHGLAAPLGGMFPAPHGAVCARLLPYVVETNVRALESRAPGHPSLDRYTELARTFTGNPAAKAMDGVHWLQELCTELNVPRLSRYGVAESHIPDVVEKAGNSSSLQGNPLRLTADELSHILRRAL